MTHIIQFPLEDGGFVLVEVDEPQTAGMIPAGRISDVLETAEITFGEALGKARLIIETVIVKLGSLSDPPDELAIKFGLKMSTEAGVVFAAAGAEASYEVSLTWKREKPRGQAQGSTDKDAAATLVKP